MISFFLLDGDSNLGIEPIQRNFISIGFPDFLEQSQSLYSGSRELVESLELLGVQLVDLCQFYRNCFLVQVESLGGPNPIVEQFHEFVC